MRIYPFKLSFSLNRAGRPYYASFPFIVDGAAVEGISCGISSRFAGDMVYSVEGRNPVPPNLAPPGLAPPSLARLALFGELGVDPARVCGLKQIHSRDVLAADRRKPPSAEADGLVCVDRETVLSVTAADCLPVYLYDTASGAFALVHSGWKGTGIVLRALELMAELCRSRPEAVAAVLGPCISVCCYKVDAERAVFFEKEFGGTFPGVEAIAGVEAAGLEAAAAAYLGPVSRCKETKDGPVWRLDLKAANVRLLAGAGVQNIAVCEDCTFTDDRLGSFRREGPQSGNYTRMLALAGYF
jgi:YfiH family protein